jgi:hypothetical protein
MIMVNNFTTKLFASDCMRIVGELYRCNKTTSKSVARIINEHEIKSVKFSIRKMIYLALMG